MRRLLLVGGGHAHLAVLRDLARRPLAHTCDVVLVSPSPRHHYSGMIPGFLRGRYAERELTVDLTALCRAAGARFVQAAAEGIDGDARVAATTAGPIAFDLASLNVGAAPAGLDRVPGARDHAHVVRPIAEAIPLARTLDRLAAGPAPVAACVVGGGAAGVEVALAVHARLGGAGRARVTLVEEAPTLLPAAPPRARRLVARVLADHGVHVRTGAAASVVAPGAVTLASGETVPSAVTIWLAGAAPGALLARSALPRDPAGYLLVDGTLRAADGAPVWGAGDCVTLRDFPDTPKSGVYAVREGPVLAHNLRAALEGGRARGYVPQRRALALLDTADGRAVAIRGPLAVHARWAMSLKSRIDRGFVGRHRI